MTASLATVRGNPPASDTRRLGSLFRYHGVWAPGVRLFRRLQFSSKALIITAVFLLPIVVLAWSFVRDKGAAIEFSSKERVGVAYVRDAMPLIGLGQALRTQALESAAKGEALPGLAQARQALDEQMKKLLVAETNFGADLGTAKALADVKAAAEAAARAKPDALLAAHSAYVDAVITLIGQAGDGSNLTLDPDLDTFYLMDGSLVAVPVLVEGAARLRGASTAVAASGKPASEEMQRIITVSAVTTELFEGRVTTALDKVYGVHADYKADFKADDLVPHLRSFRDIAQSAKADAATLISKGTQVVDGLSGLQVKMIERLDVLLQARIDGMVRERNITLAVVSAALLLGGYLFFAFFLVTQGGLAEVKRHLVAMTDGDLTTRPNPWGRDEAAALMLSLRDMQYSLRNIVNRVRDSSDSIVHASTEIAAASMDLSARTEQTAANLEESAASMEQISSTVKHTADNVREASRVAADNSQAAARGGAVISEVVSTMQEINSSSKQIGEIIGTIDGIAFQTNILALNAAVEAARAGEQGRGFAVVASEVRSLAQRSAQAAKEIKTLITGSVERVERGTDVVRGAGDTMRDLMASAARINGLLAEISNAASEQSNGVLQVGVAVTDLDKMTQQNAALVEQTAAAASALRDQAVGLSGEVAQFKLPAGQVAG
jgi:methyl-accepting chemotaxis protein